ncbi:MULTISPECIES: superoxide dismutase family protein [Sphingomonas]|jgi:Cu-Zn family superoxide dismutase|uniref:Superoxide dismutase n=1 Tax=Sphingomonas ginsenosidimutans TaxID=862134 RepID=A0A2A4I0S8_9SPHN|nr:MULTISPECIES: superoxide dismutase family protein [Sphingomonas]MBY0300494.1 superoxide dismutase family protein [Sphingomonas ginsenosidimutans]PCG10234.1 superoxide dismutase [Sphingomonas ginsenosidimutans]
MLRMVMTAGAGLAALVLAGCNDEGKMATGTPVAGGASATAMLATATGAPVGRATATDVAGGVRFTIDATGMPPGTHGAHVHMVGRCDAPDFASAGGHWNPTGMKHGAMNPQGPHQGDLPNLVIANDGRGTIAATIPGATLTALMDADGAAMVIHAQPDDLKTDPSGNSGGRIACGVFQPS